MTHWRAVIITACVHSCVWKCQNLEKRGKLPVSGVKKAELSPNHLGVV